MGINELIEAMWAMRANMAEKMYSQAMLISWAVGGKNFPRTARDAMPNMFPPRKRYAMPDGLKKAIQKTEGKQNE